MNTTLLDSKKGSTLVDNIKFIIILIALAIPIRGCLISPYKIPSSSMEPTLLIGDYILVSKISYGFRLPFIEKTLYQYDTPKRGDIVVFTRPDEPETEKDESEDDYIKRVIGLPGDTVEVRRTIVYINGELYKEDAAHAHWVYGGIADFGPQKVPADHIFLLGDNRDQSKDSRKWTPSAFLDIKLVKGRAFLIYFNPNFDLSRFFKKLR